MSSIVLDTNAYIRFLGGDERVLAELGRADSVYLSVFVLGELFAGFRAGHVRGRTVIASTRSSSGRASASSMPRGKPARSTAGCTRR